MQLSSASVGRQPSALADPFISLPDLIKQIGASRSSIYVWVNAGTFPKPCKLGPRRIAWRRSTVENWAASRPEAA
jgi:prophage regulatory protein